MIKSEKTNSSLLVYVIPAGLMALCWMNLNSGFWNFENFGQNLRGTFNACRAFLPYLMALVGSVYFCMTSKVWDHWSNPVFWLFLYGIWVMGAGIFSPQPYIAYYWGFAFFMALTIPSAFFLHGRNSGKNGVDPGSAVLMVSWILLGIYMAGAYLVLGNAIFSEREILSTTQTYGEEFAMRSSGIGRLFGLGAIILFTFWWNRRTLATSLLLLPATLAALVVWNAQSRGAITAFALTIIFIILVSRKKAFPILALFFIMAGAAVTLIPDKVGGIKEQFISHYMREDQNVESLMQMTGRLRAYQSGMEEIRQHPVAGQGFWADRMTIYEHVHNSFLQAAMNGGIPGLVFYLLAWFMGWRLFLLTYSRYDQLDKLRQTLFYPAAAVMLFLLIRSIPETTAASFSIDLLLLVPVFYFFHATLGEQHR